MVSVRANIRAFTPVTLIPFLSQLLECKVEICTGNVVRIALKKRMGAEDGYEAVSTTTSLQTLTLNVNVAVYIQGVSWFAPMNW